MNKSALVILAVLAVMLVTSPLAWGYGNADGANGQGGAHRKINEYALILFLARAEKDPILSKYDFVPSSAAELGIKLQAGEHPFVADCLTVTESGDWHRDEVSIDVKGLPWLPTYITESMASRPFLWWMIEGGYTADEPESYMALRHFYDPTSSGYDSQTRKENVPYLTDSLDPTLSPLLMGANPRMDCKQWAMSASPYSNKTFTDNLSQAWKGSDLAAGPGRYGKVWRSLGEMQHLLADMTVPAHVRNDAHPGALSRYWENLKDLKGDPYEEYVTASEVTDREKYSVNPAFQTAIDKCVTPEELFEAVARFTNSKYFSTDTVAGTDGVTKVHVNGFNKQPKAFAAPLLDGLKFVASSTADGSGYYQNSAGSNLARRDADGRHRIDRVCAMDQANTLVPEAIAANARLLEICIPRVNLTLPSLDIKTKTITFHADTFAWDKESSSYQKSSASVCPTARDRVLLFTMVGTKKNYWLPMSYKGNGNFTVNAAEFTTDILAALQRDKKTNKILYAVAIDMGGILVKSDVAEQPVALTVIPPSKPATPKPPAKPAPKTTEKPAVKPATNINLSGSWVDVHLSVTYRDSKGTKLPSSQMYDSPDYAWTTSIEGYIDIDTHTWSGNTFRITGKARDGDPGPLETADEYAGPVSVEGTVSADGGTLTRLVAERICMKETGDKPQYSKKRLVLQNIPLKPDMYGGVSFNTSSLPDIMKHLVSLEWIGLADMPSEHWDVKYPLKPSVEQGTEPGDQLVLSVKFMPKRVAR